MESSGIEDQGRIAFVQSCWHREIVDVARDAFLAEVARSEEHTSELQSP